MSPQAIARRMQQMEELRELVISLRNGILCDTEEQARQILKHDTHKTTAD